MTVSAELRAKLTAVQIGANDQGNPEFRPTLDYFKQFASGTGADQADLIWTDTRTLAASGTENLDLAGVLTDAFGAVITAVEIVAIMVTAAPGNANNVVLGNHATAAILLFGAAAHTFAVKPGGVFLAVAPNASGLLTVTPATADMLMVTNSAGGTPVTYTIAILGRTA